MGSGKEDKCLLDALLHHGWEFVVGGTATWPSWRKFSSGRDNRVWWTDMYGGRFHTYSSGDMGSFSWPPGDGFVVGFVVASSKEG